MPGKGSGNILSARAIVITKRPHLHAHRPYKPAEKDRFKKKKCQTR